MKAIIGSDSSFYTTKENDTRKAPNAPVTLVQSVKRPEHALPNLYMMEL